jgi:4-amino-4-deoxy-L-arabinose transferase-like glycosyltransferase
MKYVKILMAFLFLFVLQLSIAIFYFYDQSGKDSNSLKSLNSKGEEYIVPGGHEYSFGDTDAYNKFAYSLLEYGDFYNPAGELSAWITPGYPLFLAFIYLVFGYGYLPVLIIQALLLTLSYYFLFIMAQYAFNRPVALISIALLLLNFKITVYIQSIYTEILFLSFLSIFLYLSYKIYRKKDSDYKLYIATGILLGFLFMIRPVILPVMIILFFTLLIRKIELKKILVLFTFVFISISPWLIRNYLIFGRLVISTSSEITMSSPVLNLNNFSFFEIYGLKRFTEANYKDYDQSFKDKIISFRKNNKIDTTINYPQGYIYEPVGYLFGQERNKWIKSNFGKYLFRTLYLFKAVVSPYTNDMSARNKIISTIIWILIFIPTLLGLLFLKKNWFYWVLLLYGLALLFLPALTIIDGDLRYQLPSQLVFTPLAAYFYYSILPNDLRNKYGQKVKAIN